MIVRQFNASGIAAFEAFLAECRTHPQMPVPRNLLKDNSLAERIGPHIAVEPKHFTLRRDAADYLAKLLEPLPPDEIAENAGLWTWLSLFFFDEVCPVHDGRRQIRSPQFYVYEPKLVRRAYYHLLFIPWRIAHIAPNHGRIFLTGPVHQQNEVTRLVMKRLYLLRIPCIFEVLDRLYWDDQGAKTTKRHCVERKGRSR